MVTGSGVQAGVVTGGVYTGVGVGVGSGIDEGERQRSNGTRTREEAVGPDSPGAGC